MTKRALIQSKFGNKCAYCGKELDYKNVTLDHVVPKSQGGANAEHNLFPACQGCNELKRDMPIEGFREVLGGGLFYFEMKAKQEREIVEAVSRMQGKLD